MAAAIVVGGYVMLVGVVVLLAHFVAWVKDGGLRWRNTK